MKKDKQTKTKSENKILKVLSWPLKVLVITFALSFLFSNVSEIVMSKASLMISIFVAIFFIGIAVLFDIIALSTTSCDKEPFLAMASRKVSGAKQALMLINVAPKISTICADIVGDMCGILSGTVCARIIVSFCIINPSLDGNTVFAALISSILAALTVSIKSFSKYYSVNYSNQIMLFIGKTLYFLGFGKTKKNKKKSK